MLIIHQPSLAKASAEMECHDAELFVELPDERYECQICCGVMREAMQGPCQHHFGRGCLEKSVLEHGSCPTCRAPLTLLNLTPARLMRELVGELSRRCERGCTAAIKFDEYESHLLHHCPMMVCPHEECGAVFERVAYDNHRSQCVYDEGGRLARLKAVELLSQQFRQRVVENAVEAVSPALRENTRLVGLCAHRSAKITEELDQLAIPRDDAASRHARKVLLAKLKAVEDAASQLQEAMKAFTTTLSSI
jgi:hypothetical protein